MKHPVLVRVFAVILCILCLAMAGAGLIGLQKAENDYNNNKFAADKMLADIDEYKQLLAENDGKESYDSAHESLEDLKESHEEVSAEHRTELATYTATKGGMKTVTEALDKADEVMANAKADFNAGKAEFEKQYKEFMKGYEAYQTAAAMIAQMQAEADKLAPLVAGVSAESLQAAKEYLDLEQSQIEAEQAELNSQIPENGEMSEELSFNLGKLEEKKAAHAQSVFQHEMQSKAFEGYSTLTVQIEAIKQQIAGVDPAQLEVLKAQLDAGAQQMAEAEKQLASAEYELYHNRALVWYELGQLEEQAAEMADTKVQLQEEEQEIILKEQLTEQQKQREKRLRSLYLGFTEKPEIEEAVKAEKDFVESVEAYIVKFNNDAQEDAKLRGYANVLMIVAVLAAFICLLASFEIIKKPAVVRSSAFIMFALASAALGIFLWMGRGVSYSAAAVVFFALIQFLVAGKIKRKKA